MRQVKHRPEEPKGGEDVRITVKVTDSDDVNSVTLSYQLVDPGSYVRLNDALYESDWTSVEMTDDGTVGKQGKITDFLLNYTKEADQIFACGPLPMYRAMAQIPELTNKSVQVSLEVRMGCGRGVCYGCSVKTKNGMKKVCEDGPVFELNEIIWDELADM